MFAAADRPETRYDAQLTPWRQIGRSHLAFAETGQMVAIGTSGMAHFARTAWVVAAVAESGLPDSLAGAGQ